MSNRPIILVVDDETIVRETLEALLAGEDYELLFAENGYDGIQMALQRLPDIILMDVMMPGLDGFETCRHIRAIPLLAQVPLVLVTALEDRDSRRAGLKAGADDFISKPYDIVELLLRIQNMIKLNRYRQLIEQRGELQRLHNQLLDAYDKTIVGWSRALDMRDHETEGHTQRVAEMTLQLARAAGLNEDQLKHLWRGCLLHDVGKLGIPDAILLKAGPLDAEEWVTMRGHTDLAFEWLSPIDYLAQSLEIPYCHHEKWDGSGYPRHLQGEQIPFSARLFAIVDVWDALTSDRPYRKAMSSEQAMQYITSQTGKHFDPCVVELFLKVFSQSRLTG